MAKNRISNEVGATVFAILSGLAALFLTAWIFGTGGCSRDSGDRMAFLNPAGAAGGELSAKLDETSASLDEANAALNEEAERRAKLAAESRKLADEKQSLTTDLADLQKKYDELAASSEELTVNFDDLKLDVDGKNVKLAQLEADLATAKKSRCRYALEIAKRQQGQNRGIYQIGECA